MLPFGHLRWTGTQAYEATRNALRAGGVIDYSPPGTTLSSMLFGWNDREAGRSGPDAIWRQLDELRKKQSTLEKLWWSCISSEEAEKCRCENAGNQWVIRFDCKSDLCYRGVPGDIGGIAGAGVGAGVAVGYGLSAVATGGITIAAGLLGWGAGYMYCSQSACCENQ